MGETALIVSRKLSPERRTDPMKSRPVLPLLVLFLLCLFPVFTHAQTATVAAWNIEGFNPVTAAKARRAAKAIHNLQPDVIALVEVNPNATAVTIVNELANLGDHYSMRILTQSASQNIALVFKNGVTVSNLRLIPGSDAGNSRLRKALSATVRIGQFDFILIAVHMKAGRPANGSSDDPRIVRNRQATAIANFIRTATQGVEKDVLVVGDYNMIPGEDNSNFSRMSPGDSTAEFLRYVSNESLSGQTSHISGCNPARGSLLDGFAISKTFTTEYTANSLRIVPFSDTSVFTSSSGSALTCSSYKANISDHLPLVARFNISSDDDPLNGGRSRMGFLDFLHRG
jgi:endonuclease/exonuclease/phosphatase family metal-dependent hydrolase